jgi:hypothetical protein
MADGIRKHFEELSFGCTKGIILHRAIDTLPMRIHFDKVLKLHEKYHHYSGVL